MEEASFRRNSNAYNMWHQTEEGRNPHMSTSPSYEYFTMKKRILYLTYSMVGVLLEKLTGLQLVKKFPAFHGTQRFITALTSVHHLSQSWASLIQSIYPHPTSWRSFLILSTHLRLGLPSALSLRFPHQDPIHSPLLTHMRHMSSPSHSRFYHLHNTG